MRGYAVAQVVEAHFFCYFCFADQLLYYVIVTISPHSFIGFIEYKSFMIYPGSFMVVVVFQFLFYLLVDGDGPSFCSLTFSDVEYIFTKMDVVCIQVFRFCSSQSATIK